MPSISRPALIYSRFTFSLAACLFEKTKTKTAEPGKDAYTYRLVESVRVGTQVKQRTRPNLGKNFAIEPPHWPLLAARIEQFLQGSAPHPAELFALADEVGQLLEAAAVRSSKFIIAKLAQSVAGSGARADLSSCRH